MARRFAYLHGFASGPRTYKGTRLAAEFARRGLAFHVPDLNLPSFAELTFSGMLDERLTAKEGSPAPWCLVGSSMGGYVAARWAELHPDRVVRLVLLCPGFDLPARWRDLHGDERLSAWRRDGTVEVPDLDGRPTRIDWRLMEDASTHPAFPEVPCPTLLLHGRHDDVVPLATSEAYAATRPQVTLEVLDDDHGLVASLPAIERRVLEWFEV